MPIIDDSDFQEDIKPYRSLLDQMEALSIESRSYADYETPTFDARASSSDCAWWTDRININPNHAYITPYGSLYIQEDDSVEDGAPVVTMRPRQ